MTFTHTGRTRWLRLTISALCSITADTFIFNSFMSSIIILVVFVYIVLVLGILHRLYLRVWREAQRQAHIQIIVQAQDMASGYQKRMGELTVQQCEEDELTYARYEGAKLATQELARALAVTLYEKTQ